MGLMDILNRYAGLAADSAAPHAAQDFGQVAQFAPREDLAQGIAHAFRADATPPFGDMVQRLFRESGGEQRAGLLNEIARSLAPGAIAALGTSPLARMLRRASAGQPITRDEAADVRPDAIAGVAHQAANRDPSLIDRISRFYAQHPALVQTLGNAALSIALSRMAQRRAA